MLSPRTLLKLFNFYPPYLGAGVRIKSNPEMTVYDVSMKLRFWNSNYVGTHFGGSLYSMCDPFYMLILMNILGRDYLVWDKAASISFKKPGKGRVSAHFEITPAEVDDIKRQVEINGKYEPQFEVEVCDEEGNTVAKIQKTLWVKKKNEG